jgi:Tat protein secretion system quality control protein TatD with DNase activity
LRGTVNEPKNVAIITAFLASLKERELTEFASVIKTNAKTLFYKLK